MMYRTHVQWYCYIDVACSWPLELILPFLFGRVLRANDFARYTYATSFSFLRSLCLGFFFITGVGMDIIFKDLEAETIHVCIAWHCWISWVVFYCFVTFYFAHLLRIVSVHGIGGLVNNASLPLVCGWLGLVAKPWDAELFLFEIDILGGLSRSASLDHYALKMLSFSFILFSWFCISFALVGTPGELWHSKIIWCRFT